MTSYLEKINKEREIRLTQAKKLLNEICEILSKVKITSIEIKYDGCSDSGCVQEILFFIDSEQYEGELPKNTFHPLDDFSREGKGFLNIEGILEEIAYEFIPYGWEIDEGGFGHMIINVKEKVVSHEHNQHYLETEQTTQEHTL